MKVAFEVLSNGPSASLSAAVPTDANGEVSVTATANDLVGGYQIVATVEGLDTPPATFNLANIPAQPPGLDFYTLTPCRVLDTRQSGGALPSGVARSLSIAGACGVPATAKAVSFNLTATAPTAAGSVAFYPDTGAPPIQGSTGTAGTIDFTSGQTRANNQVLALAAIADGTLQVQSNIPGGGSVHVIVDVNGYFQ